MDTYVARQPIFNKNVEIYAYELLFRGGGTESSYTASDADKASSRVIIDSFHTMGLDTLTGNRPAFINFTETLLREGVATLFPKDSLVIELLETIEPTFDIVWVCEELCKKGYTLALDDFVYRPELEPLIKLAKIIKFDFLGSTIDEISDMLSRVDMSDKILLAEKIETVEMFNQAASMGFSLFQGYFFSKPVTMVSKEIAPLKINYLSLMKEINEGYDMDYNRLADIVQNDVSLTYKLLRMVNSAYYGLRWEVTDIKHALAVLGVKEIRKWLLLVSMMGMNTNKPDELTRLSMIRARFMEQISSHCRGYNSADNMFMTGLFSLIDALLDQPMDVALANIVLAPEVYNALVKHTGDLYELLNLVVSLERGDWDEADRMAAMFGLQASQVTDVYLETVKWCDNLLNQ